MWPGVERIELIPGGNGMDTVPFRLRKHGPGPLLSRLESRFLRLSSKGVIQLPGLPTPETEYNSNGYAGIPPRMLQIIPNAHFSFPSSRSPWTLAEWHRADSALVPVHPTG